jgi:succinoglycan biosynthesis protein ExoV
MKMIYFQGKHRNFGDDLNLWQWPRLLPDFFDDDEKTVFIGIGSIIGMHKFPEGTQKILFGPGVVPKYNTPPDISGPDWTTYFVRGPRTARLLGLTPDKALSDGAILLRTLVETSNRKPDTISFMPHWESLERGQWEKACALAGITLIDPRGTVDDVLSQMLRSKVIIAEAMHGAIVADALRIPWVPLLPLNPVHRDKWFDWAEALNIRLARHRLWPSSLLEARLWKLRKPITASPLAGPLEKALPHLAAHRLTQLAKIPGQLSEDREIERVTARMLEKLEELKRDFAA